MVRGGEIGCGVLGQLGIMEFDRGARLGHCASRRGLGRTWPDYASPPVAAVNSSHSCEYSGMEVSDAKRLRGLEDENAKLKRLLADAMLDVSTLKDMLGKTSNARCKEASRGLGNERKSVLATPRL